VQVIEAVKVTDPPNERVSEDGLTLTDARPGSIVMVAELSMVTPFSVALTKSVTVPAVFLAVNVTD
jgi:hypothetical protein